MLGSLMCIYMHSYIYLSQIHGHVVLYVRSYNMRMYRLVQETRIPRDMHVCGETRIPGETYITVTCRSLTH